MREYVEAMKERYRSAGRRDKSRLLGEFTEVTGYHRKSAIRLLSGVSGATGAGTAGRTGRPKKYGHETVVAFRQVWEVAGRLCGRRLAPFMGELVTKLQEWEELRVSEEGAQRLCEMSVSTMDRLLRPYSYS